MKTSNVSTAAASGGVTGAAVVLIVWALSLVNIAVPGEVSAALMVVITPLIHLVAIRLGVEPAAIVAVPPPAAPAAVVVPAVPAQ